MQRPFCRLRVLCHFRCAPALVYPEVSYQSFVCVFFFFMALLVKNSFLASTSGESQCRFNSVVQLKNSPRGAVPCSLIHAHILISCFNSKDSRRQIPSLPLAARRLICYLDLQFSSIVHGVLWMLDDGKVHFFPTLLFFH